MHVLPDTVISLLEELEADYPPKCKSPAESLEDHAQYAGKVALVVTLRGRFDAETKRNIKELPKVLK